MAITGTQDGIDKILTEYHQLNTLGLTTPSAVNARTRILSDWQRAVDYFYILRNWHFRYVDDTSVGQSGDDFIALPANWGNEGRDGVVWDVTHQKPVGWIGLRDIKTMQERFPDETGEPRHYSVRGIPTTSVPTALIFPKFSGDTTLRFQFQARKPTLEDLNPGGLQYVPEQWWETILFEYAKWLEMKHVGAASEAVIQKQLWEDMLFNACIEETQGKTIPDYMPRFPGSASVWEVDVP
jgi:hypothetical protein